MNALLGRVADLSLDGVGHYLNFVRDLYRAAMRPAHDRKAQRQREQAARCSEQKLTDEMERRIIQRLTRNHSFRL